MPAVETKKNADKTALAANKITVTALDGDWSKSASSLLILALMRK